MSLSPKQLKKFKEYVSEIEGLSKDYGYWLVNDKTYLPRINKLLTKAESSFLTWVEGLVK